MSWNDFASRNVPLSTSKLAELRGMGSWSRLFRIFFNLDHRGEKMESLQVALVFRFLVNSLKMVMTQHKIVYIFFWGGGWSAIFIDAFAR